MELKINTKKLILLKLTNNTVLKLKKKGLIIKFLTIIYIIKEVIIFILKLNFLIIQAFSVKF
jgi:hypothetical protein